MAWSVPLPVILLTQCTGPYCGPDSDFERPNFGVGGAGAPAVAMTSEGTLLVAWESRAGAEPDVLFNRRSPGEAGTWFELPRRLDSDDPGAARSLEVRLAAASSGEIYAVWQDGRSGKDDVYFDRSLDGGETWGETDVRVNSSPPGTSHSTMASLAADGRGRVYVVWEDLRNGRRDVYFSRSTDRGRTWEGDRRLDTDAAGSGISYHPQILTWDDGTLSVCWWDERAGLADLYVRRSTDAGETWEAEEIRIDPGDPGATASRDARWSVSNERIVIAWEELERDGAHVVSRTSEDRGGTWGELVTHGRGEDPLALAREGPASVAWTSKPARWVVEKTSIGGRIVEIMPPVTFHASLPAPSAPARARHQSLSNLEGPATIWLGASAGWTWAARTGTNGGRGIVEVFSEEANGGWRRQRILPFGGHLLATDREVLAHSLRGAVGRDGTLHLVWVADFGGAEELGYYQLGRDREAPKNEGPVRP